jgi:hypothetical protein
VTASAPGGPDPGGWPLSAAATRVLHAPGAGGPDVVRLALRELVLRDVVRAGDVVRRRWRVPRVRLLPGAVSGEGLPAPLPDLAAALRPHLGHDGADAAKAMRAAAGRRADLDDRLGRACRDDLVARGLLRVDERRRLLLVRRRWVHTPSGRVWVEASSGPAVLATGAAPALGLLLALDQATIAALRREGLVEAGIDWEHGDLDALDGALGDALDSAADSGGDGGGDGGGD